MSTNEVSRRRFLQGLGLAGAGAALHGKAVAQAPDAGKGAAPGKARNLIFLVADGMGTGTLSLAHYWHLQHRHEPLQWMGLYQRPGMYQAMQETASANSPVTDSAAAASAWGSGERVNNGRINIGADRKPRKTLYDFAREAGKARGLVTTCRVTHATPAGFATNVLKRDNETEIARQYLAREIDVLYGGGDEIYRGEEAGDLLEQYRRAGYAIVGDRDGVARADKTKPVLGLFAESHIPYAIDRDNDPALAGVPSLPFLFEDALARLDKRPDGFLLQVEAGRVDHAGHANDPAAILHDQLEFDACIAVATRYIDSHPDTLLIVTTDHGTGGCQLNGVGPAYTGSAMALSDLNLQTASFESLGEAFREAGRVLPERFESAMGFPLTPEMQVAIQAKVDAGVRYVSSAIAEACADILLERRGIGWTSNNHTAENVELLATGPGASAVSGWVRNDAVFGILMDALALG